LEASLGYTLSQLSQWSESEQHFCAAIAQGQDDYGVHYYLGSALVKTGDFTEARQHLEKAALLDPEQPGPHFLLASVYRSSGEKERVAAELKLFRDCSAKQETRWRADALKKAAEQALGRGDLAQGIDALEQAYQSRPTAEAARNLSLAYLQKSDLAQAEAWLTKALALSPNDAASHNYMGLVQSRRGNLAAALQHFETAVRLDASYAEAGYNAGVNALDLRDTKRAIQCLEHTVKTSDEARFHEALPMALSEAGRDEDARKHFDVAQRKR
jgi:tetratricopeptide (TPR) repeat protein